MIIKRVRSGIVAGLFAVDEFAKEHAEKTLEMGEEKKLTEKIVLRRVHNTGMSLNYLSEKPELVKWMSAGMTLLVSGARIVLVRKRGHFLEKTGLTLAAAGAWSNTWDRWIRGYVVDYIGFRTANEKLKYLTYNLGDFFIGAGGILWLLGNIHSEKKQ